MIQIEFDKERTGQHFTKVFFDEESQKLYVPCWDKSIQLICYWNEYMRIERDEGTYVDVTAIFPLMQTFLPELATAALALLTKCQRGDYVPHAD